MPALLRGSTASSRPCPAAHYVCTMVEESQHSFVSASVRTNNYVEYSRQGSSRVRCPVLLIPNSRIGGFCFTEKIHHGRAGVAKSAVFSPRSTAFTSTPCLTINLTTSWFDREALPRADICSHPSQRVWNSHRPSAASPLFLGCLCFAAIRRGASPLSSSRAASSSWSR